MRAADTSLPMRSGGNSSNEQVGDHMSRQIGFLIFAAAMVIGIVVQGQQRQERILTLTESINIALGKSYEAKRLEQSLVQSRMSLRAAEASFKSNGQLVFSSLPQFQQGVRQTPLPGGAFSFDREEFLNLQTELYINQPIAATDGVFSLVGSLRRFEQTATNTVESGVVQIEETNDITNYNPQFRLQFRQPLFTINRRKLGYRRAALDLERTEQQYTRSQLDLIYNISTNFYNLYRAQRGLEIEQDRVQQSENAYRIARLKHQAGLLPEVEALRLEIDLSNAQNSAATQEANLRQFEDGFKLLVGIPIEEEISVVTELTYDPVQVSQEKAISEALKRRTEPRTDDIEIELGEINIEETDSQSEIVGELFMSYGIFKVAEKFKNSFQDFDNDRSVRFSLTVPIWDWGQNSSQVQAAQASLSSSRLNRQNRIEEIKREIRTAVRDLESARKRADITVRSEALAEKSYRINLLKFESGDINSQDLALEQDRLTQARLNSLDSIIDYKQALADLRRKTLWDFEKGEAVKVFVPENE